ncbi:unnamed protein product [Linum trigynum]|uniref:Gnk2-homologous domain-containing protein n=1 Tax=Linum trigynum TaxID=586398 RepID=A0AAV2DFQ1_9ROSI
MAGCYVIFPKSLLMVVLLVVGNLGGGSSHDYCGKTRPNDEDNFPLYVDAVLQDLVENTQQQYADAGTGDTTYTSIRPEGSAAGSEAANGTATCYVGYTGDSCGTCLSNVQKYLSPCREFTTGSGYYAHKCSIAFSQL